MLLIIPAWGDSSIVRRIFQFYWSLLIAKLRRLWGLLVELRMVSFIFYKMFGDLLVDFFIQTQIPESHPDTLSNIEV